MPSPKCKVVWICRFFQRRWLGLSSTTVHGWFDLLPLENLVWVKVRDYVISRANDLSSTAVEWCRAPEWRPKWKCIHPWQTVTPSANKKISGNRKRDGSYQSICFKSNLLKTSVFVDLWRLMILKETIDNSTISTHEGLTTIAQPRMGWTLK